MSVGNLGLSLFAVVALANVWALLADVVLARARVPSISQRLARRPALMQLIFLLEFAAAAGLAVHLAETADQQERLAQVQTSALPEDDMDFSRDYLTWDNVEPVTLEAPTRAAPRLVYVSVAKHRPVRISQKSPSGGVYLGYESRWLIPAAVLPADVEPAPGWVIEDGRGNRDTVLTVERLKHRETWALGTVNLVLALDLRDQVVIERSSITYDGAGVPVKGDWRPLYSLPARVQPQEANIADARGTRSARRQYEVWLGRQVPDLDVSQDRLRWLDLTGTPQAATRWLDIVSSRNEQEIENLPVLTCEERL